MNVIPRYPKVAEQLQKMVFKDQAAIFSGKYEDTIFKHNCRILKKIVATYGFPSLSLVGKQGSRDAWLIGQHCDFDIPFQKEYLKMMRVAVKQEDALKQNLAFLEDRVRMNEGKPQIYGSQFRKGSGKLVPYKIKETKGLNVKRKHMGLPSLKQYLINAETFNKHRQHIPPRPHDSCPCNSGKKWKTCHGKI